MQKLDFPEAVEAVVAKDPRFDRDAYAFLKEALDYTLSLGKKARESRGGHVTGHQLLEGVRQYALRQFGPMVVTVFNYWGIRSCEDFGDMVYNLIGVGVFGRSETDSIDDFKGAYTFEDAFLAPFRPASAQAATQRARRRISKSAPASKPA